MDNQRPVIIRAPQPAHSPVARYEWRDQYGHVMLDENYYEAKERLGGMLYRCAILKGSRPEPKEDYEEQPKRQRKNNSKF